MGGRQKEELPRRPFHFGEMRMPKRSLLTTAGAADTIQLRANCRRPRESGAVQRHTEARLDGGSYFSAQGRGGRKGKAIKRLFH